MKLCRAAALALAASLLAIASCFAAAGEFSTYANPTFGFSLRYPSDCSLDQGDKVKLDWGYPGPVDMHLPVTLAAIELPRNWYSGTDFGMAFLSVSVDTKLSEALCTAGSHWVKVGAFKFEEYEDGEGGMGRSWFSEYYRIFRNRTCYEFQLGELDTGSFDVVKGIKHFDDDDVFRRLRAILATLKFHPIAASHS
jgi:hypothetical protein